MVYTWNEAAATLGAAFGQLDPAQQSAYVKNLQWQQSVDAYAATDKGFKQVYATAAAAGNLSPEVVAANAGQPRLVPMEPEGATSWLPIVAAGALAFFAFR